MKKHLFSNIRTNLTFWFLLLGLLPLTIGMVITYHNTTKVIEEKAYEKLKVISDVKVNQLQQWVEERKGNFNVVVKSIEEMEVDDGWIGESKSVENNQRFKKQMETLLKRELSSYASYDEIFIINVKTGLVEVSTDKSLEGLDKSKDLYFTEAIKSNKFYIKDIYYSPELKKNTMAFSEPIHFGIGENGQEITGILVAIIDLENSLYPILSNRTGLGKTGETLILNSNVMPLNKLRWVEDAPLKLKITTTPAVNAVQGKTGIIRSLDYRGEEVLAAYTYIPEIGWGFVCKQDWNELNEPIDVLSNQLIWLLILSAIVVSILVFFISSSISKPIIELNVNSKKIAQGDYATRNTINSRNEIGELGNSINEMVDKITSKSTIQEGVSLLSKQMIGHKTQQKYVSAILNQLITKTGACMGAFYVLDEIESEYQHFDSVGAHKNMMQAFSADFPEGEFGKAISSKKIEYLKELPENTKFQYKTSVGEITPKELITIPIINNDMVVALISLAHLNQFSTETLEIIKLSQNGLNSSYANLLASEKTEILANTLLISNQKLEAQTEELQEQSEALQSQADEMQMQNQELETQRRQVEEANQLKSEFLSNMSHELRTPLNSINALSQVLRIQTKDKLSAEENEYLEVVERNGKRLLSLINDILDLSKIEAGKMEMFPATFSLSNLVGQVVENIAPLANQKNINLVYQEPKTPIQIDTDESRLQQVLSNIIGNAVKFTEKGSVDVSIHLEENHVQIKVKDTGIGISEIDLPHIFNEFKQADGSTSRSYEGTGLGLAIAKKLTEALFGTIAVESNKEKGSVFTITLPLEWEGMLSENTLNHLPFEKNNHHKKTILVVDDDIKIVQQISHSLEENGYDTIGTTSAKEALKLAVKLKPFAITLDLMMPEMDGFEVLQNLKENPETAKIPVIIISVSDDKQTSFALGAVGYISKPVNRKDLIREIKKLNPRPKQLLIVDDNPIDRNHLHSILQKENIEDIQAENGEQCLAILENNNPDILILDLMMPGMDGFEVLNEIRKNEKTRDLPVIVVTAKDLTIKDKAQLSGKVSAVLNKSILEPATIYREINRILDQLKTVPPITTNVYSTKSSKKILIVEDNPIVILQVKKILEKEGILVDVANNGIQALAYIAKTTPDAIILDLMMPEMDGFELLENLRSTTATKLLPVLILTAKNLTKNELEQLSNNNVYQLIQKGDIDSNGLLNIVKSMLRMNTIPATIASENLEKIKDNSNETASRKVPSKNKIPKILLVEDNPDNRLTVKAILGKEFILTEAIDGEEGIQKTIDELPDLILLDISLPKKSGYEVIEVLRNNNDTKDIPIIALTAKAMKSDKEKILALGFDEYVSKPIDSVELAAKIKMLLRK